MIALDLFCGAGGASIGLSLAGFEVHGVDIQEQHSYPFTAFLADALDFSLDGYSFVWASPPCQAFTAYKRRHNHVKPRENSIPAIRRKLKKWGGPFVIENVAGAPLKKPSMLCGSMFGLDVRRHRYFESNFPIQALRCQHQLQVPRFPPATNRKNLRSTVEVGVWRIPLDAQRRAMGIGWMNLEELSEAIPPSYSKYIADQYLKWVPLL